MYSEEDTNIELQYLFNDVVRQTTRDDCSLIVLARPDEFFRGYRDLEEADQYNFLSVSTAERKENREKIFSVLAGHESLPRSKIIEMAQTLGLKRKQITGLLRTLTRKGFIEKTKPLARSYRLKFHF